MSAAEPRFAFFDVDDTLVRIKSMFDFFRFFAAIHRGSETLLARFEAEFARMRADGLPRTELNRAYYRWFAGLAPAELAHAAEVWGERRLRDPARLFLEEPVQLLGRLREEGYAPVFVSGSFPEILAPIAAHLRVEHVLSTRLIVGEDGLLTGEIDAPQTIGEGKAEAIRLFLAEVGGDAGACVAVGDDVSDLAMLDSVGAQVAVGEGGALAEVAHARGWPVIPGVEAGIEGSRLLAVR
ncbi:HAD family hydrolase [Salinarimonas ramus]|uniref:HAD-IB family hydrolase n=1 Tax=Salinarimonas ramus TaxID=690164 RepID=A0A917V3B8_9HYPH|nr:HAD-IB family hydrolase [Salinarimonas ramus]GGK30746.1 hypothetical protein GCM10011322_16680 [Salinarimonas ramus]